MSDENREILKRCMKSACTKSSYRRVLAVWLTDQTNFTQDKVAQLLGVKISFVRQARADFVKKGEGAFQRPGSGGNRKRFMENRQEVAFLKPYVERSRKGEQIAVDEIKKAFERRVGKEVAKSTVYRMLQRHKWFEKHATPLNKKVFDEKLKNEMVGLADQKTRTTSKRKTDQCSSGNPGEPEKGGTMVG
jgi:transposase